MSRRRTPKKRIVMPDPVYDSRLIELLVRQLMREGKKSLAYRICYESMNQIADATQQDPLVYTVYTTDVNRLDIQGEDNQVVCLIVSEMSPEDKAIVDKVGVICTELLNS